MIRPRLWIVVVLAAILLLDGARQAGGAALQFNDPLADQQVYLGQMRFGEAWNTIFNQPRRGQVTVAVLDSGFQSDHPDLQANLVGGFNIVDRTTNIAPAHPHGTATSGLPGASSGNATGISQSAFTANVLPIRISNRADGAAFISHIARAIRYAADSGARVINISYGGVGDKQIAAAAKYAWKRGAITFMAAGNSGVKTKWKNYKYLVAVGSVDSNNQRSAFSTYGRFVDFVALGEDVTTLSTGDGYADWSGTSFASPIAASVASLVLTANPELSPSQVLKILKKTATYLGEKRRNKEYGYGLLNAEAAVVKALNTRGRYRKRYRRSGFDPYVENTFTDLTGVLGLRGEANVGLAPFEEALGLVQFQGFISSTGPLASNVPEPATILLLAIGAAMILHRRK